MQKNIFYIQKKLIYTFTFFRLKVITQQKFLKLHKKPLSKPILDNIS